MFVTLMNQVLIVAFAGCVLWAAFGDLRRFIIPNRLVGTIAALWLVYAGLRFSAGAPLSDIALAAGVGVGAFALGVALFMGRLIGGGDAKLFAAVALWAGPTLMMPLLTTTLICGGVLALVYLAMRTGRNMVAVTVPGVAAPGFAAALRGALKTQVPFGVAIAAGGLLIAYRLFFGPVA